MYPHDYHDWEGHPFMHNRGEARPYIEPDIYASAHDAAIPVISTIGRGPKGDSVSCEWDPETNTLKVYAEENGEKVLKASVVLQSPEITITQAQEIIPGQSSHVDITVTQGGVSRTYPIILPCGEPGSISFLSNGQYDLTTGITWVPISAIGFDLDYEDYHYERPTPRINDLVLLEYIDSGGDAVWAVIVAIDDHDFNDGQGPVPAALCKVNNL